MSKINVVNHGNLYFQRQGYLPIKRMHDTETNCFSTDIKSIKNYTRVLNGQKVILFARQMKGFMVSHLSNISKH